MNDVESAVSPSPEAEASAGDGRDDHEAQHSAPARPLAVEAQRHGGELVAACTAFIRGLLEREVTRMKAAGVPVGTDEYRGLYVSPEEANRILSAPPGDGAAPFDTAYPIDDAAIKWLAGLDGARLTRLARMARLSLAETGVVLLALASECDLQLERLISYVQDDVTKKRPRVELAVRLFGGPQPVASGPLLFSGGSALRKFDIVRLHAEPGQADTPLLAQQISLDPRIAAFLVGSDAVDERLLPHALPLPPVRPHGDIGLGPAFQAEVEAMATVPVAALAVPVAAVFGPDQAARLRVATVLAAGSGMGCMAVRIPRFAAQHDLDTALMIALREGALRHCAVVLDAADLPDPAERAELRRRVRTEPLAPLVILSTPTAMNWPGLTIEVPALEFDERLARWEEHLPEGIADRPALRILAGKFKLTGDQVADAVETAHGIALRREPAGPRVDVEDIYAAARAQSTPILNDLARKVPPHYGWGDLILPEEIKEQLHEICAHMEHRATVFDEWGLSRRLAMGRGLTALFAGNSGTGKTMAAGVMSGALGLDLYKIDLSGIVSKYIGETEKNLAGIFREAETSNAILFFDEADALFGKRSEVKDAHDRYANIETAYLLQKMEEYEGIVILATNLKMNLDEAFLRRLSFVIDFPMPEEEDRLRIWQSTIPPELPLTPDVDLEFLARQFRLAGGNIRNIVLAAAFLGADEGGTVQMGHFIRATRREYQKLGRMVTASDFGEHLGLLRNESGNVRNDQ